MQKILRWRHSGFNVHSKVRAETKHEAERVGKYMIRPVLSLKRLLFDESGGKVRYRYSRHGSQEESLDYLEFIARVTSHIPDKGQVMVRHWVVDKIISHLELNFEAERPPPPQVVQQELLMAAEEQGEYF